MMSMCVVKLMILLFSLPFSGRGRSRSEESIYTPKGDKSNQIYMFILIYFMLEKYCLLCLCNIYCTHTGGKSAFPRSFPVRFRTKTVSLRAGEV